MLKIRLRRMGSTHRPFYRVVVSDSRRTPTASAIEEIGYYDPRKEPSIVSIDVERVEYWTGRGAQLSDAVKKLVRQQTARAAAEPAVAPEEKAPETAETAAQATEATPEAAADATEEVAPAEAAAAPAEAAAAEPEVAEAAVEGSESETKEAASA